MLFHSQSLLFIKKMKRIEQRRNCQPLFKRTSKFIYNKIYLKHLEFNCMFWHGLETFLIWINIFYGIVMPELSVMLFLYGKTALVVVKTFRSSPPWSLLKPGPRSWTWTQKNLDRKMQMKHSRMQKNDQKAK